MNNILKLINNISGDVLTICINDEKIMNKIEKKATNFYSINKEAKTSFLKKEKINLNKNKKINFKKLNKYFNKKSIDYIICNCDEIKNYQKYFVKNSININKKQLFIYSEDEDTIDIISKKYKRYNVNISRKSYNNFFIIIIDNQNSKNNKIKEILYFVIDTIQQISDFISNLLVS